MPRYSELEQSKLKLVREKIGQRINESPQFPEVVGDRKIMRFLRGHDYDVDKVCNMMIKWLDWRRDNKIDDIRQQIVLGGLDSPSKFPYSDIVLKYQPQAVILPFAQDKNRTPICVEKFNFSPFEVLQHLSIPQYIDFFIHCLEYKSLIVEQFSEERDNEYVNSITDEKEKEVALGLTDSPDYPPYGCLVGLCVIRDLEGLGFEHIGAQGQEILRAAISLSSDNYPELLTVSYIINSPWIFNTLWWFIHGLVAAKTVAKITVTGGAYRDLLLVNIDEVNLPSLVGGPYSVEESNRSPFPFDKKYLLPDMTETDMESLSSKLQAAHLVVVANNTTGESEEGSSSSGGGVDTKHVHVETVSDATQTEGDASAVVAIVPVPIQPATYSESSTSSTPSSVAVFNSSHSTEVATSSSSASTSSGPLIAIVPTAETMVRDDIIVDGSGI